jgi:RNA-directed DNA polymerase
VLTSDRCSVARQSGEPLKTGMQMTAVAAGAPEDDAAKWARIDWHHAHREVRRLQIRIAKAVKEGRWNKVKALQHRLTHSFYAKLLAVKRVS